MKKLDGKKLYSLKELVETGYLPFSHPTLVNYIENNLLKASKIGKGKGARYYILGENAIEFLAKLEAGDFN